MDINEMLDQIREYLIYEAEERNEIKYKLQTIVNYLYKGNLEEFINVNVCNEDYGSLINDVIDLYNEKVDLLPIMDNSDFPFYEVL